MGCGVNNIRKVIVSTAVQKQKMATSSIHTVEQTRDLGPCEEKKTKKLQDKTCCFPLVTYFLPHHFTIHP